MLSFIVTAINQEQNLQSEFVSHCFTNYEKITIYLNIGVPLSAGFCKVINSVNGRQINGMI